jgi:hypothetical protein
MNFIIIALPALLILIIMKYKYPNTITTKECLYHFLAVCVSIAIMMCLTYASIYATMADTEILNGQVIKKERHVEFCTQMSDCKHYTMREHCTRNSKGERSCTSYKDFDYSYEVDWYIKSTVGKSEIKRVNNQGTMVPPRWAIVKLGEPASAENTYFNYLLGNKESLFHEQEYKNNYTEAYKKALPDYPEVYDYYRVDHVLNLTQHSVAGYNDYINLALREMGAAKQVNIVLVLYPVKNADLPKAVLGKWRGGKKNDVIMFAALDDAGTVKNFTSTSFAMGSSNEFLHSKLRMDAMSEKMSLDLVQILVKDINTDFKRLPNSEFEYLKYKLEPSMWIVILCSILAAASSIFVGNYMRNQNL